jgi:hypothetical protein
MFSKDVQPNVRVAIENVILGSLESFVPLNHQVDISVYLTEATALHHSRKLVDSKQS